jgi:phage baseplate assembly protein W
MENLDKKLEQLIGKGLTFPIEINPSTGRPDLKSGFDLLNASLRHITAFKLGTRFFLGEFGTLVHAALEEPNDKQTQNLVFISLREAYSKYENRIELLDAKLVSSDDKINIVLNYKVKATEIENTFIYPYYKANREEL